MKFLVTGKRLSVNALQKKKAYYFAIYLNNKPIQIIAIESAMQWPAPHGSIKVQKSVFLCSPPPGTQNRVSSAPTSAGA